MSYKKKVTCSLPELAKAPEAEQNSILAGCVAPIPDCADRMFQVMPKRIAKELLDVSDQRRRHCGAVETLYERTSLCGWPTNDKELVYEELFVTSLIGAEEKNFYKTGPTGD